ncbi:MAG: SRPBCC family protein [Planctomycetota bacterium]
MNATVTRPDNLDTADAIAFDRDGRDFVLRAQQWLPASPESIWRFVGDCRHMNHVIPPFMRFRILSPIPDGVPPAIAPGAIYEYKLRLHGVGFFWRTLMKEVEYPRRFRDVQAKGPYASFSHEHTFEAMDWAGVSGTLTRDIIRYRPPGGPLAPLINATMVRRDLQKLFERRHRRMAELFAEGGDPAAELFGDKFTRHLASESPQHAPDPPAA